MMYFRAKRAKDIYVNAVPLEQFGANSVNQCYGSTGAVSSKLTTRITKQKGYIRHNYAYSMY